MFVCQFDYHKKRRLSKHVKNSQAEILKHSSPQIKKAEIKCSFISYLVHLQERKKLGYSLRNFVTGTSIAEELSSLKRFFY